MAGGELNTSTKELLLKDAAEWNASRDQQAATDVLKRRFMQVTPELEGVSRRLGLKELSTRVPMDEGS